MSHEFPICAFVISMVIVIGALIKLLWPLAKYYVFRASAPPPLQVIRSYLAHAGDRLDYVDSRSEMADRLMKECGLSMDEALLKLDEMEMLGELVYDRSGRWVITNDQHRGQLVR